VPSADGFSYAVNKLRCNVLVEMDADISHNPRYIVPLLNKISEGFDVVVGSRNIPGGAVIGWGLRRKLTSRVANIVARRICGIHIHDATSGYRAFSSSALERINIANVESDGYSFQIEALFQAQRAGLKIAEIPIVFTERKMAKSKLTSKEIFQFSLNSLSLLLKRLK